MPAAPPVAASISQLTRRPSRDGEVDRVVGPERERGHAQAVDRRRRESRVVERAARRVGEQRLSG